MAKKRKFCAYRGMERPYTRFSKYKKMSFVKARPVCKVVRFNMGAQDKDFSHTLCLISKSELQIRDNALESARMTSNRVLENTIGKSAYRMILMAYPHHVLRENPLAAGAGADRMSTGMQKSFGKCIGIAAQIKKGKILFRLDVNKENLELAKKALKRASYKIPCSCQITVEETKPKTKAVEEPKPKAKAAA